MEPMTLIIIGVALILFGVSWWWDWKESQQNRDDYYAYWQNLVARLNMSDADTKHIFERLFEIQHDLQQIKTRLTWSRKRERKDLKAETKLSTKTVIVHTKPRRFKGV